MISLTIAVHYACAYHAVKIAYYALEYIVLQNFAYYAPHVSQYSPQIQHLLSLILLKSLNHEYQQSLFFQILCSFIFLVVPLQSSAYLAIHTVYVHACINTLNYIYNFSLT